MINVNENEVKELLNSKKIYIETPKYYGVGEIVSGGSLIITLLSSEFKDISFINSIYFECVIYLISLVILIIGIYKFINSLTSEETVDRIYNEILELDVKHIHQVNIVLFKNTLSKGKYLLIKNKEWSCELFPSYNAITDQYDVSKELIYVKQNFSRDFGVHEKFLKLSYLGDMEPHLKVCAGTNIQYRYLFHFYNVDLSITDKRINQNFKHNGHKYTWKTLDQMIENKNIMRKNRDVVEYVANIDNIPYN